MQSLTDPALIPRILVGFALAFVIGFERKLRGSPAGDRTFALIGSASAVAAAVTSKSSPQALAGIITGIGFIGGGLILKGRDDTVRGVTTAATVFSTATVGLVVGLGHLVLGHRGHADAAGPGTPLHPRPAAARRPQIRQQRHLRR